MKNGTWNRRMLALLLAGCLLLGLAGCGGETAETEPEEETYGYRTTAQNVDLGLEWVISSVLEDETIYCYGSAAQTDGFAVTALDLDGTVVRTVDLPEPMQTLYSAVTVGQGFIWAVDFEEITETVATEEDTADEAADGTEWIYEEPETETVSREVYTLLQIDMDGQVVAQSELEQPEEMDGWFYVDDMALDGSGNLLVFMGDYLLVYDVTGAFLQAFQTDSSSWIDALLALPDGTVLVCCADDSVAVYDPETGFLGESVVIQTPISGYTYVYGPGQTGGVCAYSYLGLYRCDMDSGELELVLQWLDWNVDAMDLFFVVALDEETFLTLCYDNPTGQMQTTILERVPTSELPERTELILGVSALNRYISQMALSFNRTSDNYYVTIRDYSAYNTDEDKEGWVTQLRLDMLSGDFPDLLCIRPSDADAIDWKAWAARGILTDLYTLMSEDTVTQEDLVASYCAAMELDGGLYTISASFSVSTAVALTSAVGAESGWTVAEFAALAQAYAAEGKLIWAGVVQENFLAMMVNACYSAFVDTETGACRFDSADFLALLEACTLLPETREDLSALQEQAADAANSHYALDQLRAGMLLTETVTFSDMDGLRYTGELLAEDLTLIGFPGVSGSGAVLEDSDNIFAISAYTTNQAGAWEYVSAALTEEYAAQNIYGFSVLRSYLDKQAVAALDAAYYYDENGKRHLRPDATEVTQAQIDTMLGVIENASAGYRYDQDLTDIVLEEAAAFFAGQKDAETVAALIQDRAQTYLDEQG